MSKLSHTLVTFITLELRRKGIDVENIKIDEESGRISLSLWDSKDGQEAGQWEGTFYEFGELLHHLKDRSRNESV